MGPERGTALLERRTDEGRIQVDTRARRDARRDRRRAVTLLLLTLVLPGSAQVAAGNRRVGRVALKVWAGLLGAAVLVGLLALVSREAALGLLTHRWTLAVLQVVLFAVALGWAGLLVDAWRLGRPDRLPQRDRRGLLALLVGVLLVPAVVAWAGGTVGTARAAMTSIFSASASAGAVDGRYNVLLLGGDSGAGRWGLRPDSIQLASVDAETGKAVLLGFSRETEMIHFEPGSVMAGLMPDGWVCGDECLLNGLYTWAVDHRDEFPAGTENPGVVATREAVEWLTGLTVQYYVMVDLKGFRSLVDAVGGLDINVQRRTPMGSQYEVDTGQEKGWIEAGRQHLDGYDALWYARSRANSSNYERMARQRCVVTALVRQLDPQTVLLNFADIVDATTGVFSTDIPQSALAELAQLGVRTKEQKITSVNFVPPLIEPWDYDPAFVRQTVSDALEASEAKASASPSASAPATPAAAAGDASSPEPSATASVPAVMENPGTDPDANTEDLADVCAAG
jgi:LCP family protein required for cell wall assembly